MSEKPNRRWFRFSLRTMFVVVTVLCCYLGWQSSVVRQRQAVRKEMQTKGSFQFTAAREWINRFPPGTPAAPRVVPMPPVARIPLVRTWLGDEAIQEIWIYRFTQVFSEADLTRVMKTFPEAEVREILPEPCHPGCFPRGTLVDTPQGPRLIETIQPGDLVTAVLQGGATKAHQVQTVFVTDNRIWKVATEAGDLFTTQTQPLCLAGDKTLQAGKLEPGSEILFQDHEGIRSVGVLSVSPTERAEKVYNLILGDSEVFVANGFLARSKPPAVIAAR